MQFLENIDTLWKSNICLEELNIKSIQLKKKYCPPFVYVEKHRGKVMTWKIEKYIFVCFAGIDIYNFQETKYFELIDVKQHSVCVLLMTVVGPASFVKGFCHTSFSIFHTLLISSILKLLY